MSSFARFIRLAIGAWALLLLIMAAPAPSSAEQINPTASSVSERQLLQEMDRIQGRVSIPDQRSSVLMQPAGREWREFRNVVLRWIGGVAILGILAVLVIFYLTRGMVRLESGRSGRTIVRFNAFERFAHWMTATCFVILAISGLNITFGRPLLLPLIGFEAFSEWSQWAKYAHNYLSFPFTIGVVLIFLMWIGGNIPSKVDLEWIKRGGGLIGNGHPPARRFNAGQKGIYWIVVIGGGLVATTGFTLSWPCCLSRRCSLTSTSARSGWRGPSRRWDQVRWMSIGRASTTACGSTSSWHGAARTILSRSLVMLHPQLNRAGGALSTDARPLLQRLLRRVAVHGRARQLQLPP